jgi:hypothetical protein
MGDSIQLTASGASTYTWQFDLSLSQLIGASVWANPATQTTYNVTGTDVNGCTGTDQVTITVNPLPSGPTVTHDSIYLITDLSTGIQWYLDGTILPGETNDTLNYTNYSNGVYTAVYIDGNGCMSDTSQSVNPNGNVVIVDVGIEENSLINVSIYPNPSIDIVNIKLNTPIKSILIFDLNGKMILNKNGQNQTQQSIDLSYLPKGSYLLSIQTELGVITRVIIKQ